MQSFRSVALFSFVLSVSCGESAQRSPSTDPTIGPTGDVSPTTGGPSTTVTPPGTGGTVDPGTTGDETSTAGSDDDGSSIGGSDDSDSTSDTASTDTTSSPDGTSDGSDSDATDATSDATSDTASDSSDDGTDGTTTSDASEPTETGDSGEPDAGATDDEDEPDDDRKFVGNITTRNQVDAVGLTYADYWDQITPENAGKWGSVQATAGAAYNWSTLDAIYDYAQQHGLIFKQHAFIWGRQAPGNAGAIQTSDVQEWMEAFCTRYPKTKLIDVVNEPPPHTTPEFANNIGGGTNGDWQWVTNAFIWARERCPNAILILNDYNNIEWPDETQHFINIAKTVLDNGGPIDALGAQSHDLDHASVTFQRVQELLNKLHNDTGLPVYITELDLDYTDDQRQLEQYQQYFPYFMETDFVPGITIWGWIYGRTWASAPNSGLVRDSGEARPAMTWLMNELGRPIP